MKNKFKYILTVLCVFASTSLSAQQGWQWGQRVGIETNDIAVDHHGNTYVLWDAVNGYPMGGTAVHGYGYQDVGVSKFSCNGDYEWTRVVGTANPDGGISIGVDAMGGVYVLGAMASLGTDSIHVGNDTTIAPTKKSGIIIKYDTSGNFQWVKMPEDSFVYVPGATTPQLSSYSMAVLPNGNFYFIAVLRSGSYGNGVFTATYPDGNNLYTLKYDKNGNCLGGIHLDIHYAVNGAQLQSTIFMRNSSTGDYYLSGGVGGNSMLQLGDSVLSGGPTTEFAAKFDSSFNLLWVTKEQGTHVPEFKGGPAVDSAGNVYVTGESAPGYSFGPFTFHTDPQSYQVPILVKLSPTGVVLNAVNAYKSGGATWADAVAFNNGIIAVSGPSGSLQWGNSSVSYVANSGLGNLFLARFDAADLNLIDLDSIKITGFGGTFPPTANTLTTDSKGDFYMGGSFPAALYLPHDTLYNQSPDIDGYITKFGFANCNCNPPVSSFTHGDPIVNTPVSFTYNGATPVDSVLWDFGDGTVATGINVSHSYTQTTNYTVCAIAYNSCGSNMHCENLDITPTGIQEIPGFAQVGVYPNPATQTLNITHAPAGTELDIYNMVGIRVLHTLLNGNKDQLNISRLTPGVYLMRFTDKNGRRGMTKLVKE